MANELVVIEQATALDLFTAPEKVNQMLEHIKSLAEEERKRQEEAKRQADKEHRRKYNQETLQTLVSHGFDEKLATEFIKLVASNKIPPHDNELLIPTAPTPDNHPIAHLAR
ncbi:hypothetical protein SAMN05216484_11590 [Proteus mirabilis]|uniref:hypothetical protein n=1 Tax=Proteus mirabilis TaxID=584 RepID=UPI0008820B99|nr:hypothetical protein [Proteus mirabilis]SDD08382.1 hypothetical protein SAMN05216484_11590 [Proteus mirabilis]